MRRSCSALACLVITAACVAGDDGVPERDAAWLSERVKHLDDRDPAIRATAREELMSLPASKLDALAEALRVAGPLTPQQIEPLRDVVSQIVLAASIEPNPTANGFMGVTLLSDFDTVDPELHPDAGVVIVNRIRGYCGYPLLRDGDVILAVGPAGDDAKLTRVRLHTDLITEVKAKPPGARVTLSILRNGRPVSVTLKLDPRPVSLTPDQEMLQLEPRVEAIWAERFAPLIAASQPTASGDAPTTTQSNGKPTGSAALDSVQ